MNLLMLGIQHGIQNAAEQRAKAHNQLLQRAVAQGEVRFREILGVVVAEIAETRGIEIVLPVHAALFAIPEVNLTEPVIERLNEAFPEIALTFDES